MVFLSRVLLLLGGLWSEIGRVASVHRSRGRNTRSETLEPNVSEHMFLLETLKSDSIPESQVTLREYTLHPRNIHSRWYICHRLYYSWLHLNRLQVLKEPSPLNVKRSLVHQRFLEDSAMGVPAEEFIIDLVDASEVAEAHAIEIASFPPSEADSFARYQYRVRHARELFLGSYVPTLHGRTLVGVVCATAATSEHLTLRSMDEHVPSGTTVCIHAVCVLPAYRNRGIAISLLKAYIARLERSRRDGVPYERVVLITHKHLRRFYEKAGFEWLGKSDVVLGPEQWYEMCIRLSSTEPKAPLDQPSPVILPLHDCSSQPPTIPVLRLDGSSSHPRNAVPESEGATVHLNALCTEDSHGGVLSHVNGRGVNPWNSHGVSRRRTALTSRGW